MDEEPLYYRSHEITPERFGAAWRCRISGSEVTSVFGVLPTRDKVIAYAKQKIDEAWAVLTEDTVTISDLIGTGSEPCESVKSKP